MNKKQLQVFRIVDKQQQGEITSMRLVADNPLSEVRPGQFVQIKIDGSKSTYLRRPISIHDVDYSQNSISLLVQRVGEGTHVLTNKPIGSPVDIIFPLGNSYTMPKAGERVLMVGGGCGLAPYYLFGKMMKENGVKPVFLVGARSKDFIPNLDEYKDLGQVHIITDDGSLGEKGLVTQHSIWNNLQIDRLYACGTRPMMRAVVAWAKQHNVFCEISLENLMACGLGACLCCVEKTVKGNVCVCKEGPVFNINNLLW